jgi:hypothetical protein
MVSKERPSFCIRKKRAYSSSDNNKSAALAPESADRPKVAVGFLPADAAGAVTALVCPGDWDGIANMIGGNVVEGASVNGVTVGGVESVLSTNTDCVCAIGITKLEWFPDVGPSMHSRWGVIVLISFTDNRQTFRPRRENLRPTQHNLIPYAITDCIDQRQI